MMVEGSAVGSHFSQSPATCSSPTKPAGLEYSMTDEPRSGMSVDRRGLSDEMRQMLDQSEREYVGWNPEEKPQLIGTLADMTADCDCGGFGTHYILFIDEPNGDGVAVHVFHTTLRSQIEPKIKQGRFGIGDLIAISHLGTKPSTTKGHADMNMYRAVIRQKPPAQRFTPTGEVEYDNR